MVIEMVEKSGIVFVGNKMPMDYVASDNYRNVGE